MTIKKAVASDYLRVLAFYEDLIDAMPSLPYSAKWTKDVYPTKEDLRFYVERGELYYGEEEGEILAAMAINGSSNEGYDKIPWSSGLPSEETQVLHLLGVAPSHMHRGIGKRMVQEALEIAKASGAKAMRLDVVEGNLPAEKLYPSMGFSYVDRCLLYYEDTGWCYFKMFEKML